ncbi:VIT1/CCC1 transporter family protein [Methylonatrum kenyense]|uniref:VIT1/CCC1 transporter family protein n=1 Tax=Methylonatrum kenyense TaxID=455253 RepID=UPI0020BFD627|nr:VIT1/CCC1 transporter family protein [Methylonatrum kenyense]MCK8515842.1 VIT1/CCC1 transporter family protein [Methylonatrum kenyense]
MNPELNHSHDPVAIRRRLAEGNRPSYLPDAILGGIDGCITTLAVVASVAGAGLPGVVAFVLGVASLIADAFSMGVSNYQAVKASDDERRRLRAQEIHHVAVDPDGEQEEIRAIFEAKGFRGGALENIVETITSDRRLWVDTMLMEEYGVALTGPSASKAGLATFATFMAVGSIPLLPFLVPVFTGAEYFVASAIITAMALFGIGYAKGVILSMKRWRAGFETLLMGGGAAIVAFLIGTVLEPMLADLPLLD